MPIIKKLKEAFDEARISYEVFNHPLAYTAQEIAAGLHFSGKKMAKVVMLKVDGELVMGVLTANQKADMRMVKAGLKAREARLASENEFASRFPDCEIGAMPPFGNLFGIPVFVDPALEKDEYIYFNAGNHVQTVRLRFQDFIRLVKPQIAQLTESPKKMAA